MRSIYDHHHKYSIFGIQIYYTECHFNIRVRNAQSYNSKKPFRRVAGEFLNDFLIPSIDRHDGWTMFANRAPSFATINIIPDVSY